jgi:hypothetical protein
MNNIYDFFIEILKKHSIEHIQKELDVNKNTISRWIKLKKTPKQYYFDLCRIDNIPINYSEFSEKDKDQFFTDIEDAKKCILISKKVLEKFGDNFNDYNFIEPSAGNGSFFRLLPKNKSVGIDIEPRDIDIIEYDFLKWYPSTDKNLTIGNPPFGLRGNLALKFINHAAKFSDYVCFILPQLFDSNGKGSCKLRVKGLNLIHTENIGSTYFFPNGDEVKVNVVFQVWSKKHKVEEKKIDISKYVKIFSLSDGGTPGTTRNKKMLNKCDFYLPSTCFGLDKVKIYEDFESLPQRRGYGLKVLVDKENFKKVITEIEWEKIFFVSTNGAYNLRFDLIEKAISKKILNN